MANTFAVFSDRCNSTMRHVDGLTEAEAEEKAIALTVIHRWPHYAAPSDFNPHEGYEPDNEGPGGYPLQEEQPDE